MTSAILLWPGGRTQPLRLHPRRESRGWDIDLCVEGASPYPLGRQATLHAGLARGPVNNPARQIWMSLTGGSHPPVLRGPVVFTGPADRDGNLTPLPSESADVVQRVANLMNGLVRTGPFTASAAQARGERTYQCDAHAIRHDRETGRSAFVVLDGVGATSDVHHFVRRYAPRIAQGAAQTGSPNQALLAARIAANADRQTRGATATAVVAVLDPRHSYVHIAWCGDARAYRVSRFGAAIPLTADHVRAAQLHRHGLPAGGRGLRSWSASSIAAGSIAQRFVERRYMSRLLLCTDGVYAPLERWHRLGPILDGAEDAKGAAAQCVREAVAAAGADPGNGTALVVDLHR
ncbi:PP2C family protein-serine/threonine phosphatase [Streptomyces sp. NPDC056463]|uniref:PP2C family protein-serine/threonine phosphatase n=1 Tax=Streptomyces sp. NPDC056463 TaxID=3345827 RepID=UPI0036A860FD